jgi:hypothetical protein
MLIVEDGTGKPDAESYASVAAADLFHSARGNAAWAALSTSAKEINLRKATDWLGERFSTRWAGYRSTSTQALDWPRAGVCIDRVLIAANALPVPLVRATMELALKAIDGPLTADESAQVKSETVGPLSVTYADGARQQTRFAAVENTLSPLVGGSNVIRLVRS